MATETWIKDGGTWREANEAWVKDSGVWREADEVWIKDSGTWRQVFQAYPDMTAVSITGGSDIADCTSGGTCNPGGASKSFSINITGGNPNTRTYLWTRTAGNVGPTSSSSSNITVSVSGRELDAYESESETWTGYVTVTDNTGSIQSNTATITATIVNNGPS